MYKTLLWVTFGVLLAHETTAQLTVTTWTGSNSNWNANMNWDNGKPDVNKIARFVPGSGVYPAFNQPETIGGLLMEAGTYTLHLNNKLLNVIGEVEIHGGTLSGGMLFAGNFVDIQDATFQNMYLKKTGADPSYFGGHTVFSGINTFEIAGTAPAGTTVYLGFNDGYYLQFNDSTTFINNAVSATLEIAYDDGSAVFSRNLTLINTNPSTTFSFGKQGGLSTIAASRTLKLKPFSAGTLALAGITQLGGMALDTLRPTTLSIDNCHFGGRVVALPTSGISLLKQATFEANSRFEALQIAEVVNCTFMGGAVFRKNGAGDNSWDGGNRFEGLVTIINAGTGALKTAEVSGDEYLNTLTTRRSGVGALQIGATANVVSQIKGDLSTLSTTNPVQFGPGGVVFNGSTLQTIIGATGFSYPFSDLRIDNAVGLSLQIPVNITGKVEFINGVIFTSQSFPLTFLNGSTHSGSSNQSHVDGPVKRSSLNSGFLFPTGHNGVYGPIGVETAGGVPTFTAQYFAHSPDEEGYDPESLASSITRVSQTEYWTLNRNSAAGSAYVYLFWNNHSQVTEPDSIVVAHWNGSQWADEGASLWVGDPNEGFLVSAAPISNFSPFTIGSIATSPSANPLPIELLYFNAKLLDQKVRLEWATASEINNALFTIERSADGRLFEPIASIQGAGNSIETRTYSAEDERPLQGYNYYRLKQTDYDGAFTFSPIESIFLQQNDTIRLWPNPVSQYLYVDHTPAADLPQIRVYNSAGQEYSIPVTLSDHFLSLDLKALAPGVYWVQAFFGENNFVQKIIKE